MGGWVVNLLVAWQHGGMKAEPLIVLVAPDSFKGCMSAVAAAACIVKGLRRGYPGLVCRKAPMADGGEGTTAALVASAGGRYRSARVRDPLGRPIRARFGLIDDGRTAVLEMAAASGLMLLTPRERNPLRTTTAGTGDLIRAALDAGVDRILVGLGGSATNDGGAGMAQALGVRLMDARGRDLRLGAGALAHLADMDLRGLDSRLAKVTLKVACDVDNPLTGPRGASRVYGPQKGATPAMARQLDAYLKSLGALWRKMLGRDVAAMPGSGAAGGLGGGLVAFLGAQLTPGVDLVIEAVGLAERMRGCGLVVTGEGRLDGQTAHGKTPAGVARLAQRLGIPTIAICGRLGPGVEAVHRVGIAAYFEARHSPPLTEAELPRQGPARVAETATQVGRLLALGQLKRAFKARMTAKASAT